MDSNKINIQQYREFHDQQYNVNLKYENDTISLIIESQTEPSIWKNTFTNKYIEDLSKKTGKTKQFSEFCQLLSEGIKNSQPEMSSLDILTYQDLENMKAKKQGLPPPNQSQLNPVQIQANKRYIILSVSVNQNNPNEKVHYPLTLNHEETNDVDKLKSTLKKLKSELELAKSQKESISVTSSQNGLQNKNNGLQQSGENKQNFFITENVEKKLMNSTNSSINSHAASEMSLIQENELLKAKIKRLEESFSQRKGALEVDNIIQKKIDLEYELDSMKLSSQREISRLQQTLDERDMELAKKRDEINKLRLDFSQNLSGDEGVSKLKDHFSRMTQETESEIIRSRKTIQSLQKDHDKAQTDIDFFKRQDQKQKNRIRQLEIQLETTAKRGGKTSYNDRLYSPYNKTGVSSGRRANSVPTKSYSPSNRTNNARPQQPGAKPGIQSSQARNTSGGSVGNKMSPSYNYGYKRNTQPVTTSNRQTGGYPRNTSNTNNTSNRNISPGYQRYGVNRNTSNNSNTRLSPNTSTTRQSPGVGSRLTQNTRQSPGQRLNTNNSTNNRQSPGVVSRLTQNTRQSPSYGQNRPVNSQQNKISPNVSRNQPGARNGVGATNTSGARNTTGVRNNSPQNRYNNQSPGTRYHNYMAGKKPVGGGRNTTGNMGNNQEFNDKHLKTNNVSKPQQQQNKDLDSRLDRLQGLLSKAKK